MRSMRSAVTPARLPLPGIMSGRARVMMVLVGAMVFGFPAAADAQGFIASAGSRGARVEIAGGDAGTQGYSSAAVNVEYRFVACRGAGEPSIMMSWRLTPGSLSTSSSYWYAGQQHSIVPSPELRAVPLAGTVHSAGRVIGTIGSREATFTQVITGDCNTPGLNYAPVADLRPYADPDNPAAVQSFLSTLTFTPGPSSQPIRDSDVERGIQTAMRQAEREAEEARRAEEARLAAEAEAAAATSSAQTSATSGVSPSASSGAAQPTEEMSPEEAARQEQIRQQEEAARTIANLEREWEEERRRQQETEDAMVNTATSAASAALGMGLGFGGYYFTTGGGDSYGFEALNGFGMGFDAGFMYLDVGMLTGTYGENFIENYAEENFGTTIEPGVSGFFGNGGFALEMQMGDGNALGISGGMMYAVTPETEFYNPVVGLIGNFGTIKVRVDMGVGDEPFVGGAVYLHP